MEIRRFTSIANPATNLVEDPASAPPSVTEPTSEAPTHVPSHGGEMARARRTPQPRTAAARSAALSARMGRSGLSDDLVRTLALSPRVAPETTHDHAHPRGLPRNIGGDAARLPFPRIRDYRIGPARAVRNYAFRGQATDATVQTVTVGGRNIDVYAPAHLDHRQGVFHNAKQVAAGLALLPQASLDLVREVHINPVRNPEDAHWAREYNMPNFRSYMTSGAAGIVDIYPSSYPVGQRGLNETLIHETGHTFSQRTLTANDWRRWETAIANDPVYPSDYAETSKAPAEDLSDTLIFYALTKGTPNEARYRAQMPNRFAELDRLTANRPAGGHRAPPPVNEDPWFGWDD